MTSILGPRGLGDILGETFSIYKRNFLKLFVIVAIVEVAPLGILLFAVFCFRALAPIPPAEIGIGRLLTLLIPIGIVLLVFLIVVWPLMQGALIHAVSEQYLRKTIGIGRAYRFAWRNLGAGIRAMFLAVLALVGMSITIIGIPFVIYFGVRWTFILQAVSLEHVGAKAALSRSSALVKGNWWRVLGIVLVVGILAAVVSAILAQIPVVGGIIGGTLSTTIVIIGATLLYYDLRVRKEGYNLDILALDALSEELHIEQEEKVQDLELDLELEKEQKKRDNAFLKCWRKGMSDEELARKFNLKIEGVKALKERLIGFEKKRNH